MCSYKSAQQNECWPSPSFCGRQNNVFLFFSGTRTWPKGSIQPRVFYSFHFIKKKSNKEALSSFSFTLTFSLTLYSKNPKKNDDHHHSTWLFQAPKRNAIFLLLNIIVFFACVCVYVLDKTRRWKGRNEMAHPKTRSAYCCSIDLGPGGCRPQHHHGLSDRCGCSAIAATFDWYSHTHTAHTSFLHTHTPNCGSGGWGGRKQSSPIKSSFNHLLKQVNILLSFFLKKTKQK